MLHKTIGEVRIPDWHAERMRLSSARRRVHSHQNVGLRRRGDSFDADPTAQRVDEEGLFGCGKDGYGEDGFAQASADHG